MQTLDVKQATLHEAFGGGAIQLSTTLTEGDVQGSPRLPETARGASHTGRTQGRLRSLDDGPVTEDVDSPLDCSLGPPITVSGSLAVTPTIDMTVDVGLTGVSYASLTGTVDESASLSATAEAGAECELSPTPLLLEPIDFDPIVVFVGVVPVVVIPELQFYLQGDGSITASVTAGFTQEADVTAGIQYQNGKYSPVSSFTHSFSPSPVTATDAASADFSVGPELDLLLYGVAGPEVSVDVALDFDANTSDNPWWTLKGCIDAGAGIIAPVVRPQLHR